MAHKGVNGEGDNKYKAGVTANEYARVHKWLHWHYGAASKCESEKCRKKSTTFHWALKAGCNYEKNKDNFIELCVSCHKKYDWKQEYSEKLSNRVVKAETREKRRLAQTGKKASNETKKKLSLRFSGKNNPMYGVSIKGEDSAWWGKSHTEESKLKILGKNAKVNKEQIIEIKKLFENGEKQKDISVKFNLSKASVCRIINNKRYKLWG